MKKRIVIQFAVTAKEKRAIAAAAKRDGKTVSEWLRAEAGRARTLQRLRHEGERREPRQSWAAQ